MLSRQAGLTGIKQSHYCPRAIQRPCTRKPDRPVCPQGPYENTLKNNGNTTKTSRNLQQGFTLAAEIRRGLKLRDQTDEADGDPLAASEETLWGKQLLTTACWEDVYLFGSTEFAIGHVEWGRPKRCERKEDGWMDGWR